MKTPEQREREAEEINRQILDAAFALFSKEKIESVSMQKVADEAGIGVATVFRHYPNKRALALGVEADIIRGFFLKATKERTPEYLEGVDAIDRLSFTLDLYIDLYENHKEILLFNDNLNHFMHTQKDGEDQPSDYMNLMVPLTSRFHAMYERAKQDGTMRTDLSEMELQRVLLHTMMGTCNHYAGGFLWGASESPDYGQDLRLLKEILMNFARGKRKE